jgi:hypothetical protein
MAGRPAGRPADDNFAALIASQQERKPKVNVSWGCTQAQWEVNGMSRKKRKNSEAELDELGTDPGQVGPESGGQSGDTQGLAEVSEAVSESVENLAEDDQAYEAEVVDGVEEAGDHPEKPVRSHEDRRPAHESELPPDPDWK